MAKLVFFVKPQPLGVTQRALQPSGIVPKVTIAFIINKTAFSSQRVRSLHEKSHCSIKYFSRCSIANEERVSCCLFPVRVVLFRFYIPTALASCSER